MGSKGKIESLGNKWSKTRSRVHPCKARKRNPQVRINRSVSIQRNCIKPEEVARFCSVDHTTLKRYRAMREGPLYIKLEGHLVRYLGKDVIDFGWRGQSKALRARCPGKID